MYSLRQPVSAIWGGSDVLGLGSEGKANTLVSVVVDLVVSAEEDVAQDPKRIVSAEVDSDEAR